MFKLDDNLLIELGLGGLPPVEKNKMNSSMSLRVILTGMTKQVR